MASQPRYYPETVDRDEQRRAYVLELMASAEIDGVVLVKNLDAVVKWLSSGEVPATPSAKVRPIREVSL